MDSDQNDSFGTFLKRNRLTPPQAPRGESEKIWQALNQEPDISLRRTLRMGFGLFHWGAALGLGVALSLAVVFTNWGERDASEPTLDSSQMVDAEMIEESLELDFLDNGEIAEVTVLATLGD